MLTLSFPDIENYGYKIKEGNFVRIIKKFECSHIFISLFLSIRYLDTCMINKAFIINTLNRF